MKQILVQKNFVFQAHQMDMRKFEVGKTYEVDDAVADNWWVRAHAQVLGEPAAPKSVEGISVEEAIKQPVPHAKAQKALDVAPPMPGSKGKKATAPVFEEPKEESPSE
jgi:hypothetical protein